MMEPFIKDRYRSEEVRVNDTTRRDKDMNLKRFIITSALALLMLAGAISAQTVEVRQVTPDSQWVIAKRHTLAIRYKNNDSTSVNMIGTSVDPQVMGKAEIKYKDGRARIKLQMEDIGNPQAIGPYYT